MRCKNPDKGKVKPLDELFEEKIDTFESGEDRQCDKDLDKEMWTLGRYDDESAPQETEEYAEEVPLEDELVEEELIQSSGDRSPFRAPRKEPIVEKEAAAHGLTPENKKGKR